MTFKEFFDNYGTIEDFDGYYIDASCNDDKITVVVEVDCAEVKPDSLIEIAASKFNKQIVFYNCNNLDIRSVIGENSYHNEIVVHGNENHIMGYGKSNFKIEGNSNTAYIINNSYITVDGNDNIVEVNDDSICNCANGENNTIQLNSSAHGYICEQCVNTYVILKEESRINNLSFTSSIICFGRTICRTVNCKKVEAFGESVVYYWTEKTGKSLCQEPIDEDSGYFYKVVSYELHPLFYTDVPEITYTPGTYVYPKGFSENAKVCAEGIHFFATIAETLNFLFSRWNFRRGYYNGYQIVRLRVNFEDIAPIPISSDNIGKMRARAVYVDSIVPSEKYRDYYKFFPNYITKLNFEN